LLRRNQLVTVVHLADAGWDKPPASPGSNVRTCVWALRRTLWEPSGKPERLLTEPGGYRLRVAPGELDLATFEELVAGARVHAQRDDHARAAQQLERAIALFTGTPLDGQPLGRALSAETAGLMERRAHAIERYVESRVALGESAAVVADLRRWVIEYPLREGLWAELMRALHRAGRQAEALDAYRQVRRLLIEDIGVEPGRELQRLHRAILTDGSGVEAAA
jgi:DNA-binding SARP family transcriptional activator